MTTPEEVQKRYGATIEAVIAKAKVSGMRETATASDGAEVYAFPRGAGSIVWGVNAAGTGVNLLLGIRRPDGEDEAVSEAPAFGPRWWETDSPILESPSVS